MNKLFQKGSSIMEVLIAASILTITLGAVLVLSFATQTSRVDNDTTQTALYQARDILEVARANAEGDYLGVVSTASSTGSIYSKKLTVTDLTPCVKEAVSRITWALSPNRLQHIKLTTRLGDVATAQAMGGHCVVAPPPTGFQTLASVSGGNGDVNASGVFVKDSVIYVSANADAANKLDLLIYTYDPGPPKKIVYHGTLDISSHAGLASSNGLNGVVVVGGYAYGVNSQKNAQLIIFDVQDIDSPSIVSVASLPNITAGFTCSKADDCAPGGRTIHYHDGSLYVGTGYLAFGLSTQNHEFYVYCIDPSAGCSPASPSFKGSVNVDHNINDIQVRGSYAYLATSDNSGELTVIDLDDLSAPPILVDAPGTQDALSLYVIGSRLFLGRDGGAGANFIAYDITNPLAPSSCPSCNKNFPGENINALVVFNNLAFLVTTDKFEILNVANIDAMTPVFDPPFSLPKEGTGIDYDENYIYVPFVKQRSTLLNVYSPGS